MISKFEEELMVLNDELIKMASLVEKSIEFSSNALFSRNSEDLDDILKIERAINEKERDIEDICLKLILKHQPVAKDLRFITAALKIIRDLERIGDMSLDIAEITSELSRENLIKKTNHLEKMSDSTIFMVKKSVLAFIKEDASMARELIGFDDVVDELFDIIKLELIGLIREDIDKGPQALDLLLIAKYFERIGDHSENIAEWVLFSLDGTHIENN